MAKPILLVRVPQDVARQEFTSPEKCQILKDAAVKACPDYNVLVVFIDGITVEVIDGAYEQPKLSGYGDITVSNG